MTMTTTTPWPVLDVPRPYRPRPVRFHGLEELGDWRIKVYSIAVQGRPERPELIEATLQRAREVLPADAYAAGRAGAGFVIAHDASATSILLIYWWQGTNELHHRIFVSPLDDLSAPEPVNPLPVGRVWELEVIDFERRAWLGDVLADGEGPHVERYLSRWFEGEI